MEVADFPGSPTVVTQSRSPEPPRSTRRGRPGHARGARCERTSKAITTFLVDPMARVDGECMNLDGTV